MNSARASRFRHFSQERIHIAAQGLDGEIRPRQAKLGLAAQAAGADARSRG